MRRYQPPDPPLLPSCRAAMRCAGCDAERGITITSLRLRNIFGNSGGPQRPSFGCTSSLQRGKESPESSCTVVESSQHEIRQKWSIAHWWRNFLLALGSSSLPLRPSGFPVIFFFFGLACCECRRRKEEAAHLQCCWNKAW